MGGVLTRFLQRAIPALKEHQQVIEVLKNQDVIQQQQIAMLQDQKALLEKHVVDLTDELTNAHGIIEELKLNSKRLMVFGGFCALGAIYYAKNLHKENPVHSGDDDLEDDNDNNDVGEPIAIPDSLECIVCMEKPKEVMMEPCGHVCICRTCADIMRLPSGRVKCPVCRIRAETRTVFIT